MWFGGFCFLSPVLFPVLFVSVPAGGTGSATGTEPGLGAMFRASHQSRGTPPLMSEYRGAGQPETGYNTERRYLDSTYILLQGPCANGPQIVTRRRPCELRIQMEELRIQLDRGKAERKKKQTSWPHTCSDDGLRVLFDIPRSPWSSTTAENPPSKPPSGTPQPPRTPPRAPPQRPHTRPA